MVLGVVQLVLLVRNQNTVGGNLLVDVVHLGMQQTNFLVNDVLPGNNVRNIILIRLVLLFQILNL